MRGRQILKSIMEQNDISNAALAKRLGISGAAAWERVNNKNVKDIPSSLLVTMLRAMDYKLVVVPADSKLPDNSYEVD